MNIIPDDFFGIVEQLDATALQFDLPEIKEPLDRLEGAAIKVGKSWSGSWIGYHSCVYYRELRTAPPGARFSQEWGLMPTAFVSDTRGDWVEYDYDVVYQAIYDLANNPNLKPAEELTENTRTIFEESRAEVLSMLITILDQREDAFIAMLKKEAEQITSQNTSDFVDYYRPAGSFMTRDSVAMGRGFLTPPHYAILAKILTIRHSCLVCKKLANVAKRTASHLIKQERRERRNQEIGTNIFIGHGRSLIWKELKDFIQGRLKLPWDEFNRIPIAGVTNISRLSQMLDDAAIAFLIMTAEDEQADGSIQARMNVIHEAGLFQGKLGFMKAIILLEEGCEEFSNIQGLGQIRFPKGNIKAVFEEIRQILEREGLIIS